MIDNLIEGMLFYEIMKENDKTEWIEQKKPTLGETLYPEEYYECKRCGYNNNYPTRYCPNCGREAKRKDK